MIVFISIAIIIALLLRHVFLWQSLDLTYLYKGNTIYFGHRGDRLNYPENTLVSYRSAIEKGLQGVEVDVMMTKDGYVVCSHNFDLKRETTGVGFINELFLSDIKNIRTGKQYLGSKQQPIPQLIEVVETLPESCIINIEIKTSSTFDLKTAITVAKMIKAGKVPQRVIVSSFNPLAIRVIKLIDKTIPTGYIYSKQKNFKGVFIARPDCLHPKKSMLNKSVIEFCKKRNMYINVWTLNDVNEIKGILNKQVDGIIIDIPELFNDI